MPFQGPGQSDKELREPMVIEQEKPINYETKIDIDKAKNNPPDITGLAVDDQTTPGIEFRTIHAICRPEDPDCYVVSMPFHFRYVEGQDKIRLVLIRVENDGLISPDLVYYEDKGNETKKEKRLRNLRFDTVDYPYIGSKGNVFLDLTLDMNKTYCFQLEEGSLKSDIWCQNFEVDAFSRDFIQFAVNLVEENQEVYLSISFNSLGEGPIKRLLNQSSLKIVYPQEFGGQEVKFSSQELVHNFRKCNEYSLSVLKLPGIDNTEFNKLLPTIENNTSIPSDYLFSIEMKQNNVSMWQEVNAMPECNMASLLCLNESS
jgi:hypothetical protein